MVMEALGSARFHDFIEVLKKFRDGSTTKEQIQCYVEVLFFQHPLLLAQFQTEVLHMPPVQHYPYQHSKTPSSFLSAASAPSSPKSGVCLHGSSSGLHEGLNPRYAPLATSSVGPTGADGTRVDHGLSINSPASQWVTAHQELQAWNSGAPAAWITPHAGANPNHLQQRELLGTQNAVGAIQQQHFPQGPVNLSYSNSSLYAQSAANVAMHRYSQHYVQQRSYPEKTGRREVSSLWQNKEKVKTA